MRGCGYTLALVTACFFLTACSSDEASLEAQYQSEIKNVLESISSSEPFRHDVTALPATNKLTHEHIIMYIWVKANAMQMALEKNALSHQANPPATDENQVVKTINSDEQPREASGKVRLLSSVEKKVLERFNYTQETYVRVGDVLDVTLDFMDVVKSPEVTALVSKHDPAIKENLTLVQNAKQLLEIVNRYPIDRFIQRPSPGQQT